MKLFYNENNKDPIYYAQLGIRNGKKVTTRNVKHYMALYKESFLRITKPKSPYFVRDSGFINYFKC